MESILHKIRYSMDTLGPAEKKIARRLFESAEEMVSLSITEFAARCDCGIATVVRFSRRMGLAGYQELKIRVATELNATSIVDSHIESGDSCFAIFQKRIADINASLCSTASVIDEQTLDLAAQTIMKANRIVIFGLGNSAAIAQDATHKFLRLGLNAQACCDNHMQAIIASHLKRGSIAIGVSHSGSSKDIVEALRLCKVYGATTISLSNWGSSPLADVSDISLFTKSDETKRSILAMSSRIAQLAIFDSIYTYIILHTDKESKQAIYNTEAALQEKKY